MFEMTNLSVSVNGHQLLRIDSLSMPREGCIFVLGPNGAGKSTLLRTLVGLQDYTGRIQWSQDNWNQVPSLKKSKLISWVPSQTVLSFDISVFDLVMLGRYPMHAGYPKADDRNAVDSLLSRLGIDSFRHRFMSSLSSGEQQKVHIARALAAECRLMVLDEPCAHLDLKARFELMDMLKTSGAMIIMASHDHLLAEAFASHSLLIRNGQVDALLEGCPDRKDLEALYGITIPG
ncbi:MAG: ABC transporter ATP-binding protein [Pseudobacteriovorax sp.]|nr:ABC transporter ATP-binding protein [Pseudobacteriovorax sp.]